MDNSMSLTIRPSPDFLAVNTVNAHFQMERPVLYGPGRTLHEIYSSLSSVAETSANRAAHILGLGPLAAATRIAAHFDDGHHRELKLDTLGNASSQNLGKNCSKLMDYALSTESIGTQIDAFRSLITLTTKYPGLRHLFVECRYVRGIEITEDTISALWDRSRDSCGQDWDFLRKFAAACIADVDISGILEEDPKTSTWIDGRRGGLSVVERLLVAADSGGRSNFSTFLAIRYLGGILELPSFWSQTGPVYEPVVKKIITKTAVFLKDIGIDSLEDGAATEPSDFEGIDILCKGILYGMQSWMVGRDNLDLMDLFWYDSLYQLLLLLRQPKVADLLPHAWPYATSSEMKRWVPTSYQTRVFSTLVAPAPRVPSTGTIPSLVPELSLSGNSIDTGIRASSEFYANPPPRTDGSGVTAVLPSDDAGDVYQAQPSVAPSFRDAGRGKWWSLPALYGHLRFRRIGNDPRLVHDPTLAPDIPPHRPLFATKNSTVTSLPEELNARNEVESLAARSHSSAPPAHTHLEAPTGTGKPINPLAIFNQRTQKFNQSVGWLYSADHISKDGAAAQGEPLYVWSATVLLDGVEFGRGTGSTKKAGRRAAAEQALARMDAQDGLQISGSTSSSPQTQLSAAVAPHSSPDPGREETHSLISKGKNE
ncbi:hypothetical protein FB451DRAFT_47485 [Mycena latifolia]|nr:hypothetical protein FB451DRAFT_47485 [Mycena latifolia]